MTGYEIVRDLIKSVGNNTAIRNFCAERFDKQPVFYLAADEHDPPAKEKAPFVMFWQESADYNSEPGAIIRPLGVGCVVEDKATDSDEFIEKAYCGFETIEAFEALVYAAIETYLDESLQTSSIIDAGEVVFKHYYPFFHAVRQLRISTVRE